MEESSLSGLAIIPNEEILKVSPFYKDLKEGESHGKGILDFSLLWDLGITPASLGLLEGEYPGYLYQVAMTSLGHAVICFDEEVWVFLPEYLSAGQKSWFYEQKQFFKRHQKKLSYVVVSNEQMIIESLECSEAKDAFQLMFEYIDNSLEFQMGGRKK